MAKHYITDGSAWEGIAEGPPEYQELRAEISQNFNDLYFDTLKALATL